MIKLKRLLSILLILTITLPILPIGEIKALASGPITVEKIEIFKEFDKNQKIIDRGITIRGTNLKDAVVKLTTNTVPITLGKIDNNISMYFAIGQAYNNRTITGIQIGDAYVDFNESSMPSIGTNGISPKRLETGKDLSITGTNLNKVNQDGITAKIESDTNTIKNIVLKDINANGTTAKIEGILGEKEQDIIFEKESKANYSVNGALQTKPIDMNARYVYRGQFTIFRNIILGDIDMVPNTGKAGSIIKFSSLFVEGSPKNLKKQDVFFLSKKGDTSLYKSSVKGKTISFGTETKGEGIDKKTYNVLTVQVPEGLTIGEYFISLTNEITVKENMIDHIYEEIILEDNKKFTVIQGGKDPSITTVTPSEGSSNGEDVTIIGEYFGSLNISEFTPDSKTPKSIKAPTGENKLIIEYGPGTFGKGVNKSTIISATREITTIIGDEASYLVDKDGNPMVEFNQGKDTIKVRTAPLSENDPEPIKDILITIKTTLIKDTPGSTPIVYEHSAIRKKGFEYIPSKVQPEVDSITPELIEVISTGTDNYNVPEGKQIAIHGKNLMIHRYIENGKEIIRYPRIQIGEVDIDKNIKPEYDVKVLDSNGVVLDGSKGRELGTKILVTIPKGMTISNVGQAKVTVTNPMRNSQVYGLPDDSKTIEFVEVLDNDRPKIDEVRPNTSPIEGNQKVTIIGERFQPGLKIFIDGNEVDKNQGKIIVNPNGKEITLIVPANREAKTQIQVMNPKGGIDWKPFTYVIAYSQPKINTFNPQEGGEGTKVVIKGSGFIQPDPTATGEIQEKLIGTRVFLGDPTIKSNDVNKYNLNLDGEIVVKPFKPNRSLFSINKLDNSFEIDKFYQGVILKDEKTNKNYIIQKQADGKIIITDGSLDKYIIELNDKNELKAYKVGVGNYSLEDKDNKLVLTSDLASDPDNNKIELSYFTVYQTELINGRQEIVGQRAIVIDENTIYFDVPEKPNTIYYDLVVVNPDTKKDTKTPGFKYLKPVGTKPKIDDNGIAPSSGDVKGGYPIVIKGKNFFTSATDYPKVYIDGQPAIVTNVDDGPDGDTITAIVPKYVGDIVKKGASRLPVRVVVQKTNGTSDGRDDLFSYVDPSTEPELKTIRPDQGNVSGEVVILEDIKHLLLRELNEDKNGIGGKNDNLLDPENGQELAEWDEDEEYYKSKILPTVYFGTTKDGYNKAKILDFSETSLRVLAPKGNAGEVEVFIVNNDGGKSNSLKYTYKASELTITSVSPSQSKKQGGVTVDIRGSGFVESEIDIYGKSNNKPMPLVRFGNLTNKDLPDEHNNSGLNRGSTIEVDIDGGLKTLYKPRENKLTLQITEEGKTYKLDINDYRGKEIYIPVDSLKDGSNKYKGTELIKVYYKKSRLTVERGYSPEATLKNKTHISLKTPSYFEATKDNKFISVFVIDPGKGQAEYTKFKYKNTDSKPIIKNILRDNEDPSPGKASDGTTINILPIHYKNGGQITIKGEDFRKDARVIIENLITIENKDLISITDTEIVFNMPDLSKFEQDKRLFENLFTVIVENVEDGESVRSDEVKPTKIYMMFTSGETNPKTDSIEPDTGVKGTKVIIKGLDFRKEVEGFSGEFKVFFGTNLAPQPYRWIDKQTIEVIAPEPTKLGKVPVKIVNPDNNPTEGNIFFTYISKPKIEDVNPKKIFTNDLKTEVTIQGQMFEPSAKVIVGGKIILTKDLKPDMKLNGSGITGVDVNGKNIYSSVIGGMETATVKVENDKTIKVTFKEAIDLENSSIIIINPDGGISDPYNDFRYEKPVPSRPLVLEGIPGFESTVQLIWSKSDDSILNKATRYEIYGRKTKDKENTFLGDTKEAEFLVKALEPDTQYTFMVRALNEHGAAIDFAIVTVKTLNLREDEKLKEKEEKRKAEENKIKTTGKEEIQNGRLNITIGTNAFVGGAGSLDLSLSKYKKQDKFTILIPIELARKDNRLTIKDSTITTIINARDLYTLAVSRNDKGNADAYLRIHLDKTTERHIPRGKKIASQAYDISFDYIYGKEKIVINELLRSGKLFLEQDTVVYPNKKNSSIYKFNEKTGQYNNLKSTGIDIKEKSKVILLSDR